MAAGGKPTSGSEASDASSDNHHPEHAVAGGAVGGGGQDDAKNQEKGGPEDAGATAEPVNGPAKEEHAKYLANQKGIGHARLDLLGVVVRIQRRQHRIHLADHLGIVAIWKQGSAGDKDHGNGRDLAAAANDLFAALLLNVDNGSVFAIVLRWAPVLHRLYHAMVGRGC